MKKKDLEKLKTELLERKEMLEAYMARQAEHGEELQEYNDTNDISGKNDEAADEITEYVNNLVISESMEKTLKDINQALSMMESGKYGICKYCGEEIPLERMRIRPVSTSCVKCKSQFTN